MGNILLVDDDDQLRNSFERLLSMEGHTVHCAASGEAAIAQVEEALPDLVIMDVRMPGCDGLSALRRIREREPRLPVIIMTAYSTTESAIEATKLGAYDYILKPFDIPDVLALMERALEAGRVMRDQVILSGRTENEDDGEALVGAGRAMQELYKAIGRAAPTDALVLLRGESGTGKELVARALYQHSERSGRPFMIINCVAIPDSLLESELFGYERGAFTGASTRRIGKIEQASGGTVFLDEIGDMPLSTQAKLLRLLQEKQIEPLGAHAPVTVDVRIIAATNRDLEAAVASGRFREDLYYRLNVVSIHLPPLRERKEDIPHLTRHFVHRFCRAMESPKPEIGKDAIHRLRAHNWPGNVRELANLLQKILIFKQGGILTAEDVADALDINGHPQAGHNRLDTPEAGSMEQAAVTGYIRRILAEHPGEKVFDGLMDEMGALVVREALGLCSGNRSHTAKMLGLSRPTLLAKIEKYGL